MEDKKDTFSYTYSAKQQEELQRIRKKYLPPEENKMEQLIRLDRSVAQKGMILSLTAGILGTLLLGIGMCCAIVWTGVWFVPGIIIGLLGIAMACCAYPLFVRVTERERKKLAPEILRLTEELMQ